MTKNRYFRTSGSSHLITHLSVLKAFLIAIVVPDVETLRPWARKKGFEGSFEELCRNKVRLGSVWSASSDLGLAQGVPSEMPTQQACHFLTFLGCQKSHPGGHGEAWEGFWPEAL